MYKRILVPTDGSELSVAAICGVAELAKPLEATVVLVTVIEPYNYNALSGYTPESIEEYDTRVHGAAEDRLQQAVAMLNAKGVATECVAVKSFSPAEAIIDCIKEHNCDCVFMASHGRKGLAAVLLGSETQKVLAMSDVPVMVYR